MVLDVVKLLEYISALTVLYRANLDSILDRRFENLPACRSLRS